MFLRGKHKRHIKTKIIFYQSKVACTEFYKAGPYCYNFYLCYPGKHVIFIWPNLYNIVYCNINYISIKEREIYLSQPIYKCLCVVVNLGRVAVKWNMQKTELLLCLWLKGWLDAKEKQDWGLLKVYQRKTNEKLFQNRPNTWKYPNP